MIPESVGVSAPTLDKALRCAVRVVEVHRCDGVATVAGGASEIPTQRVVRVCGVDGVCQSVIRV